MTTLILNGTVVNEGQMMRADIVMENDRIEAILPAGTAPRGGQEKILDAAGCFVLPGVIDTHVHFREPGMTHKADMESESRAAAYGGVTTFFDMPNTNPATTSADALCQKQAIAREKSHVNYSFFFGATNDNACNILKLDPARIPGIKVFMGSSTGNMLVDGDANLIKTFSTAASMGLPVMAHCEDNAIIQRNMLSMKELYGEDPDVVHHPEIRSAEACWVSASKAASLAMESGARLHIAHVSTARELSLASQPGITLEATVAHLLFSDEDYRKLGTRIKCNPAIKTADDRKALREAVADGRIATIGTDHAPHTLAEKQGGAAKAVSGMPMVQFSLPAMLGLVDEGVLRIEQVVKLMSHNPAQLFSIKERGFLRPGYKADIVIVSDDKPWTVTTDCIQSKCGWSPLEGRTLRWRVLHTFCNGHHILNNGILDQDYRGEEIIFDRQIK